MKSPRAYFMIRQNGLNYVEYNHSSKLCLVILTTQESVSSEQTGQGKGKKGKIESILVSKQLGEHFSGLFVKRCQTAATPRDHTTHSPLPKMNLCCRNANGEAANQSSNRRRRRFLSYRNTMHNSSTLQSCLICTWTSKCLCRSPTWCERVDKARRKQLFCTEGFCSHSEKEGGK